MDAVSSTVSPSQISVVAGELVTETVGWASVVTETVMVLEVAGDPVMQGALVDITHSTWSPSAGELSVYVALLVPTFDPFSFHW